MSGNWVTDWIVTNYVDLDPARGRLRDHRGGSITYDGHTGTDITPANFRWMDRGEPLVLAAADGRVTAVYGGEPEDRNTEPFDSSPFCDGVRNLGNYVAIAHEDLSRTVYAHLQHGSVAVAVGDTVSAGDTLGVVGSSGCSTAPHLHFEIVSPPSGGMAGVLLDPYRDELWAESVAPPYEVPFGLRDYAVIRGHFDGGQDGRTPLIDPPPNVSTIARGDRLGLAVYLSASKRGDTVRIEVRRGERRLLTRSRTLTRAYPQWSWWQWDERVEFSRGEAEVFFLLNGKTAAIQPLTIR